MSSQGNFSATHIRLVSYKARFAPDMLMDLQDEFQLAYSDYSNQTKETVTSMAWIAPALTPRSEHFQGGGNPCAERYI